VSPVVVVVMLHMPVTLCVLRRKDFSVHSANQILSLFLFLWHMRGWTTDTRRFLCFWW